MGMYDEIHCDVPLPDGYKSTVPDQVISGPGNATLQITCAGRLIDPSGMISSQMATSHFIRMTQIRRGASIVHAFCLAN